jgi:hypothetical protein
MSSQVKLLITNNAFCIVQRATAQSKTGIFRSKKNEQKERGKMHTVRPAGLKPGGASATPQPRKIPVFDCAVALCKMHYWRLVT